MIVTCPHCGTDVWPPPDGTCPSCRNVIQRLANGDEGSVSNLPTNRAVPAEIGSGGSPTRRDNVNFELRSRRRGLLGIAASGLIVALLLLQVIHGAGNLLIYVMLLFLSLALLSQIRLFLLPSRLTIREDMFVVRGFQTLGVPVGSVHDIRLVNREVQIVLKDCGEAEPAELQELLANNAVKHGYHYALPKQSFTSDQVARLRLALNMSPLDGEQTDPAASFEKRLHDLSPRALMTPTLVVANCVVFAFLWIADNRDPGPFEWTIIRFGANFAPETTSGQWWRMLSATFLHFSLLHLAFNSWVLWDIGRLVERLVGSAAFLVVYLTSGFLGATASVLWNTDVLSAGASAAVFGLFGVLLGFLLPGHRTVPIEVVKDHRSSVIAFLLFNLLLGMSIPWIDTAAHVGGLAAGLVCGLLLSQEISTDHRVTRLIRTGLVTFICLVACVLTVYLLPERSTAQSGFFVRLDSFSASWDFSKIGVASFA